ncbi:hypothetical protein CHU_1650 [Sporocytophaga myxococcoides]|uniref:DUF4412 domain-containing protein n=1 Tax=Sporocytophaga myxococcoides TaxID=153721 RepID=A0A098LIV3_9BACT|nr:DUF4412 domain-containing protein [Sporocytophaga myxococcoides]GAL86307.1 hypothetical protein CHU_1650 [Sporocytophaga myxococcoides]
MRKELLLILFVFLAGTSFSQNFEGTIKWSMKIDLKNAQHQEAVKGNSSASQMDAEIKKLEDQMNDPEFKKQMEANPQLKSLMEENLSRLQSMQGSSGGGAGGFMPTGVLIKIKDGNNLIKLEGGMSEMLGEILYLKDKDQSYSIRRKNKTYSVLPKASESKEKEPIVKVTKTGEIVKIIGYTCTKYIIQVTDQGKTINQAVWTTKEIKDFDPKGLSKMTSAGSKEAKFYLDGVEGVPLKMESDNGEMKMVMEVTELKKTPLDGSIFSIPSDYKLVKGMGF